MTKIKSIYMLKNAFIKNKHNNAVFNKQKLICVEYENGTKSYVDLVANADITDIDYFEVITKEGKTKRKDIYNETRWI